MSFFSVVFPGGHEWVPQFVSSLDQEKCIGCGRCYKVCGRNVLTLMGITEEGEVVSIDDDDDDELERKVMTIANRDNCIGCEACAKICPQRCYTHEPLTV